MGLVRLGTKTPRHFQMVASPAIPGCPQAFPGISSQFRSSAAAATVGKLKRIGQNVYIWTKTTGGVGRAWVNPPSILLYEIL